VGTSAESPPAVACYDDHPVVLDGVCAIIERSGLFSVVARGGDTEAMVRDWQELRPDLLFVDYTMPGDVLSCIRHISESPVSTRIVVFTASGDSDIALKCLEAGARGFLVKDSLADELVNAARRVLEGDIYISMRHAGRIMLDLNNRARRTNQVVGSKLSHREEQVAQLVAQALSNKEIARRLEISEKTVKNYMTNLMEKLGARNRVEVAMFAARAGDHDDETSWSSS
jgi:two-component system, NarL family, nitrate/nitrite response regulator NarL